MIYHNNPCDLSRPFYPHDDKINPLKAAMLSVCYALCLTSHKFMDGIYNSSNNVITNGYGFEDPESEVYEFTYNVHIIPFQRL